MKAAMMIVLLAGAARAEWSVDAGMGATYVLDDGIELVSRDRALTTFDVSVGRALAGPLSLRAGLTLISTEADAFKAWETSLSVRSLHAGARWTWAARPWLDVYGQGEAIVDVGTLAISQLSDTDVSIGVGAAAGAQAVLHDGEVWMLAMFAEGGYGLRLDELAFDALAPDVRASEPPAIAVAGSDAGGLSLSAPFWRLGVAVRF